MPELSITSAVPWVHPLRRAHGQVRAGRYGTSSRATIWATRAGWRGAVRLGAGQRELRRPSRVRSASLARRSCGATISGRMAARSTASGPCREGKELLIPRDGCESVADDPKEKAKRSDSLPLLTYSALGGLRQDPGRAAESSAGPRTVAHRGACGKTRVVPQNRRPRPQPAEMGARRACVVVDVWGTR